MAAEVTGGPTVGTDCRAESRWSSSSISSLAFTAASCSDRFTSTKISKASNSLVVKYNNLSAFTFLERQEVSWAEMGLDLWRAPTAEARSVCAWSSMGA